MGQCYAATSNTAGDIDFKKFKSYLSLPLKRTLIRKRSEGTLRGHISETPFILMHEPLPGPLLPQVLVEVQVSQR